MLKGGKSGPAIVLGKPEESLVIKRIQAGEMPPKQKLIVVGVKPITPGKRKSSEMDCARARRRFRPHPTLAGTEKDPLVQAKDRHVLGVPDSTPSGTAHG